MKWRVILLSIICSINVLSAKSGGTSTIHIEILPAEENIYPLALNFDNGYFNAYNHKVKITQRIQLAEPADSILLSLVMISGSKLPYEFYYHNLIATDEDGNPLPYRFDGRELKVEIDGTTDFAVSWYYQSDFFVRTYTYFTYHYCHPLNPVWQSWYFTNDAIVVDNITIDHPENIIPVTTTEKSRGDMPESSNAVVFLDKAHYNILSHHDESLTINYFQFRGLDTVTVNKSREGRYYSVIPAIGETTTQPDFIHLTESIHRLESIFGSSRLHKLNIIETDLIYMDSVGKVYGWGTQISKSQDQQIIMVDKSFCGRHQLIHEIAHFYNDTAPPADDSTYYFFDEVLTEFVSVVAFYKDQDKLRYVFEEKKRMYLEYEEKLRELSIFNISDNTIDLPGNYAPTSFIVYHRAPYQLYRFAESTGFDSFMESLTNFFIEAATYDHADWAMFEKHIYGYDPEMKLHWDILVSKM